MLTAPNVIVEIVCAGTFVLALFEALDRGTRSLSTLLAGVLFGLLAEVFFVVLFDGYQYGHFALNLPVGKGESIPLWVGLGWGTIIWVSMLAGTRSGLPWYGAPILDAFCALSLDLTLDPIAEHLGWWHWQRPAQFFGIPCDNFIGWLVIVGAYSFANRALFERWPEGKSRTRDSLLPVVSLVPAILAVVAMQYGVPFIYALLGEPLTLLVLLLGGGIPLFTAWKPTALTWDPPTVAIPAMYQGLMLALLLTTRGPEALIVVFWAVAALSLFLFRWRT